MAAFETIVTIEQFLAMPNDGIERWLVQGRLRERTQCFGDRLHARTLAIIAAALENWRSTHSDARSAAFCGDVGVILGRDPDTCVGIDAVFVAGDTMSRLTDNDALIDGVPTLTVEILSPSDTQEETHEKISEYLRAGVALVWIVDPDDRTVRVYRPDARPQLFNEDQELNGDPHLPGFRVAVRRMFE